MVPRLVVAAGLAAVALVVSGSSDAAEPAGVSAPWLVRRAQESVRFAGTGHVTASGVGVVDGRRWSVNRDGDYDLARHRWNEEDSYAVDGDAWWSFLVGTPEVLYETESVSRGTPPGKWYTVEPHYEPGTPPAVQAVLAFAAGPAARPEGDGWSVEGTVSMRLAVVLLGVNAGTPDDTARALVTASDHRAPATLVVGPDRRVRELRLRGDALGPTPFLPDAMRRTLPGARNTSRFLDLGLPVSVVAPQPYQWAQP